jgi:catechol 2,3-dioxygenase-like lactoylglutathione lyase family enzyme
MDFLHVRLRAPGGALAALAAFYAEELGFERVESVDDRLAFPIGATRLEFVASPGRPFYHFALLAPGNRFDAVLAWARERTELLADTDSGELVFDFSSWDARACYFHDPVGNIVEVIAHRGIGETRAEGPFVAAELFGLSELGLVGDPAAMADPLARRLGLELWDGTLDEPSRLAFVGERARTLILGPPGRGWLPTGRPAEPHPADAVLSGSPEGDVVLEDSRYRIRRGGRSATHITTRHARQDFVIPRE